MMDKIILWLHLKFPVRKSHTEILHAIEEHEKQIHRATEALDHGIAMLNGENGWWCRKRDSKQDKEECS